ncbi:MAG: type II toxin-antitoxin system VapC family toxin [Paracoccaceae bacterium]|nr:type II toxin-antitoxin system VapC family toxin [Paracoccaceae bacterium]
MNAFALDCSITISWLFDDEASPETNRLLDRLAVNERAIVPGLWHLEVGNVLVHAERRKRIGAAKIAALFERLSRPPIAADTETDRHAFRETLALSRSHGLTTYDAANLELAMRRGLALATRDNALLRAAHRVEVETMP